MKKKRKAINIVSRIFALISFIVFLVFSYYIFKLNMLPDKYLIIIFSVLAFIYIVLYCLLLPKKIKNKFKVISMVFLTIFTILFSCGIVYMDKTIGFIDKINDTVAQKKEYYVTTLSSSNVTNIEELKDKKIGIYVSGSTKNTDKAVAELNKKITFEKVEYENIVEMFEDLCDKKIDAVLMNDAIKNAIDTDLGYLNLSLKNIISIMVPIETVEIVKVVDVTTTPFNIYVAGGDAYGTIDKITNTDVNMIISVNPKMHQILLTSIPRDYYVNLVGLGDDAYDKLTHAGYYGIETSIKSVEKLLDIEINYYVKINFSTIEQVIDAIGGVNVYSDFNFCTGGGTTDTCYTVGNNYLNGELALAFARERQAFSNGDVQRVKNQQKVLTAILNKFTSSTTLITRYTSILNSISESFTTNLSEKDISRLVKMQLNDMRGWTIESQNLVGYDLFTEETYTFPGTRLYVMRRDEDSVNDASQKISTFIGN